MLDAEPEHPFAASVCIAALNDLASCRTVIASFTSTPAGPILHSALGPIPYTAIVVWCREHGLDAEARAIVIAGVQHIEADRLERDAKKRGA